MTADTTFKEFVEEKGLNFYLLEFGSRQYTDLVEAFNEAKVKLNAEEESREHERVRSWVTLKEQSSAAGLRGRRGGAPKSGARFAESR